MLSVEDWAEIRRLRLAAGPRILGDRADVEHPEENG